jgi:beta-glucosidase-like glycosyl hydrolase
MNAARLLLPAVRWDAEHGFQNQWGEIENALQLGVGGFILFGGEAGAVRDLTEELVRRAAHPLLIGSDLERGAGQQFRGATPLPPAAAIGSLGDLAATRRAGEITAREARALGVNWVFAPDADVDLEPENPIIGTRSFSPDPERAGEQVAAWIEGCRDGGALSCAKHFPGHGRTVGDSHAERPTVDVDRSLLEQDLRPFRSAIAAGVSSMMTAHVAYPALDPSGSPATLSAPILQHLLRSELGFEGMIVTDAIIMEGMVAGLDEPTAGALAVAAGCDMLLYPKDAPALVAGLQSAIDDGRLSHARIDEAIRRVTSFAESVAGPPVGKWGREEDRRWAMDTAVRTLQVVRGQPALTSDAVRLVEIEDDLGGPYPPYPRTALPAALRAAGIRIVDEGAPLVALYSDIRAWKGRPGLSMMARERVREVTADFPDATILLFSHPRLASEIPSARNLLAAWGGEGLMQEAAVAWLTGSTGALPSAAGGLDR